MSRRTTKTLAPRSAAAALAAAALVAALLVTACSAPITPPPTAPAEKFMAPAATPSTAPAGPTSALAPTRPPQIALPTPPPEMSRDDETGAIAAARHFLDLYRYTESSQDVAAWAAVSHPECVFCRSVMKDVADRKAAGELVTPAAMTVHAVRTSPLGPLAYSVEFDLSTGPDAVSRVDGTLVSEGNQERGRMAAVVVYQQSRWIVREVDLEAGQ